MLVQSRQALWVMIGLLMLSSCGNKNGRARVQGREEPDGGPAQHWTQGERLKKVMGQIAGLHDAFPKGLPDDAESPAGREARRALAETAAVANALADAARYIPGAIENKPMSANDRNGFIAEAKRLHQQAIVLRDAARANQIEPLQGMLDGINATCIACHSRYRDISGDLNSHKAMGPALDRDRFASARNTR